MSIPIPSPSAADASQNQTEAYNLSWGDYHINLQESLQELRHSEDFLDVTLCVDDDRSLQAHKVILSACSPYFRSVLRRHAGSSPSNLVLLMPPETRFSDLASLIEFVYSGEVSVPQSEIESFMALAKHFKIKGLTPERENSSSNTLHSVAPAYPPSKTKNNSTAKRARYEENTSAREFYEPPPPPPPQSEFFPPEEKQQLNTGTKLMGLICPSCRTLCHDVQSLKEHMAHACPGTIHPLEETETEVDYPQQRQKTMFTCNICDKSFKSQKSMLTHQKRLHKGGEEGHELAGPPAAATPKKRNKKSCNVKSALPPPPPIDIRQLEEEKAFIETLGHKTGPVRMMPPIKGERFSAISGRPPVSSSEGEEPPLQAPVRTVPQRIPNNPQPPPPSSSTTTPQHYRTTSSNIKQHPPQKSKSMDLKKIGQKLGNQISITTSESDDSFNNHHPHMHHRPGGVPQKLTITKLKGDEPLGTPFSFNNQPMRSQSNSSNSGQPVPESIQLKEEPVFEPKEGSYEEEGMVQEDEENPDVEDEDMYHEG